MKGNLFFVFEGNNGGVDDVRQTSQQYIYSDGKGKQGRGVKKIHEIINTNPTIAVENQSNGTEKGFSMRKDTKATLYVQFRDANQRIVDNTLAAPYLDNIQWSSTKEAVADVKKDASGVILSANGEGKTNIKAQITLGGKVYKAQYTVTVVDGENAEISVLSIDNFTVGENDTEKNVFSYYAKDTLGTVDSTIQATMTNATKLTAKSSNSSTPFFNPRIQIASAWYMRIKKTVY